MANDKNTLIKIDNKEFTIPKPSPRQKIKFLELLKELDINYCELVQVSYRMIDDKYATDKDRDFMIKTQLIITENYDFNARLASFWLVEKGKSFTESFELNENIVYEYAMDTYIEGISFTNFITQMF